jgi:hypothetical protein
MILRKDVELPDDEGLLKPDVPIWIVDLFNTYNKDPNLIRRIQQHGNGKKVICYFSAGTSETFRPDFERFNDEDIGGKVDMGEGQGYWQGENWLDIRSPNVFKVMRERIKLANEAGCDAIDPDNMGKFPLCFLRCSLNYFIRRLGQHIQ